MDVVLRVRDDLLIDELTHHLRATGLAAVALLASLLCLAPGPRPAAAADRLLAPERSCPGQLRAGARPAVQEQAMRCLVRFARKRAGLPGLAANRKLGRAAERKAADILHCDDFSHSACGRSFTHWPERVGYGRGCWRAAENIAWGRGAAATPRSIFAAWLGSPGHRANLLGRYRDQGIGLRIGALDGARTHVWTHLFGSRCGRNG